MGAPITIDSTSPEAGWPPFLEWAKAALRCADPADVARVEIDDRDAKRPTATVTFYAYDRHGQRIIDTVKQVPATYVLVGIVDQPPLHPDRDVEPQH